MGSRRGAEAEERRREPQAARLEPSSVGQDQQLGLDRESCPWVLEVRRGFDPLDSSFLDSAISVWLGQPGGPRR